MFAIQTTKHVKTDVILSIDKGVDYYHHTNKIIQVPLDLDVVGNRKIIKGQIDANTTALERLWINVLKMKTEKFIVVEKDNIIMYYHVPECTFEDIWIKAKFDLNNIPEIVCTLKKPDHNDPEIEWSITRHTIKSCLNNTKFNSLGIHLECCKHHAPITFFPNDASILLFKKTAIDDTVWTIIDLIAIATLSLHTCTTQQWKLTILGPMEKMQDMDEFYEKFDPSQYGLCIDDDKILFLDIPSNMKTQFEKPPTIFQKLCCLNQGLTLDKIQQTFYS